MAYIPKGVKSLPVHPALGRLAWLKGVWRCDRAQGFYPTISDFAYGEELHFESVGQPMLNYFSFTWHADNMTPMHQERGFLRIKPDTDKVALVLAHNFGLTSMEEGQVDGQSMKLASTNVGRMAFCKDPAVVKIERELFLEGDKLRQITYMETNNTPMTKHLEATYEKISE